MKRESKRLKKAQDHVSTTAPKRAKNIFQVENGNFRVMKTTHRELVTAMIARKEFILTAHVLWDTGCAVTVITNIFAAFLQVMKEVTDFSTAIFGFLHLALILFTMTSTYTTTAGIRIFVCFMFCSTI